MKKLLILLFAILSIASHAQTANDFASYKLYTGAYSFGINPGYYGGWTTQQVCKLGSNVGVKNFRMLLYDSHMELYGYNVFTPDYNYITGTLGAKDLACILGGVSQSFELSNWPNRWDTAFYNGFDSATHMFKGIYQPIWLDSAKTKINPANAYANFIYKTVSIYGPLGVKFWEVWNEPDFGWGEGGWLADSDPNAANTWFSRDPSPSDMANLKAPFQYYVRLLRISWEVIKKIQPNAYVCTGGIGYKSFLGALLRNTDNPDGGKVTTDYPLTAGAYFDVISFHCYPEFSPLIRYWKNGIVYERHSDRLVDGLMWIKNGMDSVARSYGYNGVKYPAKQFICTETGCSRDNNLANGFGGPEVQLNYLLKAHVRMMKDGSIKQSYWFTTADGDGASATNHWGMFGLYQSISGLQPAAVALNNQGIAQKTISAKLYSKTYDAVKTASLNIPAAADGAAFKGGDGKYTYVLWAKTNTDLSETASAVISLPQCIRTEWNGSASTVSGNVTLTATPSFFEPVITALPIDTTPKPKPPVPHKKYHVKVYRLTDGYKIYDRQNVDLAEVKKILPKKQPLAIIYNDDKNSYTEKIIKL